MSALSKHGAELYRYLSKNNVDIVAVMADGTRHYKRAGGTWKLLSCKKPEVSLADWTKNKLNARINLLNTEPWRLKVTAVPSMSKLEEWMNDGKCKTPTGQWVEPDGVGSDGVPSWAVLMGLI